MKVLGIRYCDVSEQASELSQFFNDIGLPQKDLGECDGSSVFSGAIFPAGDSWIELWQKSASMPACTMLQIIVDDVLSFIEVAKTNGLEVNGPFEQHGERMFFLTAPNGMQISIQSKL